MKRIVRPNNRVVAWAVMLGADTPRRLAAEWRISYDAAVARLRRARIAGFITRDSRGIFHAQEPALT